MWLLGMVLVWFVRQGAGVVFRDGAGVVFRHGAGVVC